MNGSMVSRYPSGSNSAAAAVRATSTPIACSATCRSGTRLIGDALVGLGQRHLRQHRGGEHRTDEAEPERKEAGARTERIGQRIAKRGHERGQEDAEEAQAGDLPAQFASLAAADRHGFLPPAPALEHSWGAALCHRRFLDAMTLFEQAPRIISQTSWHDQPHSFADLCLARFRRAVSIRVTTLTVDHGSLTPRPHPACTVIRGVKRERRNTQAERLSRLRHG